MKELQAAYAADPRFAILGMDEDEQLDAAIMFVAEDKITWPQARLAIDSDLAKQFGATAIPLTLLISPEGKILARDLRGDELKKAIDAARNKNAGIPAHLNRTTLRRQNAVRTPALL